MFYALYSKAFMLYILKYFVAFQFFHKKKKNIFLSKNINFFIFKIFRIDLQKLEKKK